MKVKKQETQQKMSHSKYWENPDKRRACSFSGVLAYFPFTHYTLFICKPCTIHAQYIPYSSHNSHSNKLHRLLIHTTTSAYKLNRLSSPVKLQPSTTQLILHVALHTQCYLLHSLPHARIPFCAHK